MHHAPVWRVHGVQLGAQGAGVDADSWARCSSAGLTARTQTDSVLDDREIEERWGDHLMRPLMPLLEGLLSGATNEAAHLLAITDAKGIVLWKGADREIFSAEHFSTDVYPP
jgi:transcriptional regulator of acetoin/glycerol metabolism